MQSQSVPLYTPLDRLQRAFNQALKGVRDASLSELLKTFRLPQTGNRREISNCYSSNTNLLLKAAASRTSNSPDDLQAQLLPFVVILAVIQAQLDESLPKRLFPTGRTNKLAQSLGLQSFEHMQIAVRETIKRRNWHHFLTEHNKPLQLRHVHSVSVEATEAAAAHAHKPTHTEEAQREAQAVHTTQTAPFQPIPNVEGLIGTRTFASLQQPLSLLQNEALLVLCSVLSPEHGEQLMSEIEECELDNTTICSLIVDAGSCITARLSSKRCVKLCEDVEITHTQLEALLATLQPTSKHTVFTVPRSLVRIGVHFTSTKQTSQGQVLTSPSMMTWRFPQPHMESAMLIAPLLTNTSNSVLVIGRPGAGKTTLLRSAAALLSRSNSVIVIDTSGELNAEIGASRVMQVPYEVTLNECILRAITEHEPEVLVIDELSGAAQIAAARQAAFKGVRLIASVHAEDFESLCVSPETQPLIGEIDTAPMSDLVASSRKRTSDEQNDPDFTKFKKERLYEPPFASAVVLREFLRVQVYPNTAIAVDSLLCGLDCSAVEVSGTRTEDALSVTGSLVTVPHRA